MSLPVLSLRHRSAGRKDRDTGDRFGAALVAIWLLGTLAGLACLLLLVQQHTTRPAPIAATVSASA